MDNPFLQANAAPVETATIGNCTCLKCGYNLRGLQRDGNCPECGQSIDASLDPNRLIHANPTRLRVVQIGYVGLAISPAVFAAVWLAVRMIPGDLVGDLMTVIVLSSAYWMVCLLLAGTASFRTDAALSIHVFRVRLRLCMAIIGIAIVLVVGALVSRSALLGLAALTLLLSATLVSARDLVHLARWLVLLSHRIESAINIESLLPLHAFATAGAIAIWIGIVAGGTAEGFDGSFVGALAEGVACCLVPAMAVGLLFLIGFLIIGWVYCLVVVWTLQQLIRQATSLLESPPT